MKIIPLLFLLRMLCILILGQVLLAGHAFGQVLVSKDSSNNKPGFSSRVDRVLDAVNPAVTSNEGMTIIQITRTTVDHGLKQAALGHHVAAVQGVKGGASSETIGKHLENKANLNNASKILGVGGTLITHAGWTSTGAGEIAGGRWGQAIFTAINGIGKAATTLIGTAVGGTLGSAGGPAGTIAGGAAGGYAGRNLWDATGGRLISVIKDNLGKQEDKNSFASMAGAKIPAGKTPEQIHKEWLEFKANRDKQKELANKSGKGDLKGNEATSTGMPNDMGTKDGSKGIGLDGFVNDKTAKTDSQSQSSFDGMKSNSELSKASTSGDQQISDANNIKDKGGADSQKTKNDSATQTATADKKDSWASTLISSVTKGLETGASALGNAIGTAAGGKATGAIFDGKKGKKNDNKEGDKGDSDSKAGDKGKKDSSSGKGKKSSSSGKGKTGTCNDGDCGSSGTSGGGTDPTGPYADAIKQYGKPTSYMGDGRPYWGKGDKNDPYTDHGIQPAGTAPASQSSGTAQTASAKPNTGASSGTSASTTKTPPATSASTPAVSKPTGKCPVCGKPTYGTDKYDSFDCYLSDPNRPGVVKDPNYRDPNLIWTPTSREQAESNMKAIEEKANAMKEAEKAIPK
ncbi:MAG: hypothetical protein PHI84_21305 [Kiritimatiellae bacterium]|nr:hypothetical protein [Kiritimatiellia bacterium]